MLNEAQQEAVNTITGPVLIIAGAGSGKTHSLISRIVNMYKHGISMNNVLMLTFTNKAADEMKMRAERELPGVSSDLTACTFHSFCVKLLKEYGSMAGIGDFTILSENDSADAMDVAKNNMYEYLKYNDTERYELYKDETIPPYKKILGAYSLSVNTGRYFRDVLMEDSKLMFHADICEELVEAWKEYKKSHMYFTYDDLLVMCNEMLKSNKNIQDKVKQVYKYIMVDEYQDTNELQLEMLKLITDETHNNICVVGDDFQSIYRFRGANFKNILNFKNLYKDTKIIILNQNYRSNQEILDTANAVILSGKEKFEKNLTAQFAEHYKPDIIRHYSSSDDIDYIYDEIVKYQSEEKPLHEFAVLFKTGRESYLLEAKLNKLGIPYVKQGGPKFMDKDYVRDVLALLKFANNQRDELSFNRIIKMIRNIGSVNAKRLSDGVVAHGMEWLVSDENKKKRYYNDLEYFCSFIRKIKDEPLPDQIHMIDDFYFRQMFILYETSNIKAPDKEALIEKNKENKKEFAIFYEMIKGYSTAEEFVYAMTLDGINMNETDDAIVLSTIHSAKGLEWDRVYILNCTDKTFPTPWCDEDEIEEQRRLFYVAITRARHKLVIFAPFYVDVYGRPQEADISPFLSESSQIISTYELQNLWEYTDLLKN